MGRLLCTNGGARECLQDHLIRFLAPPSPRLHKRSNSYLSLSLSLSLSFITALRGGHIRSLQRLSRISPRASATEWRGWSSQARQTGWRKLFAGQARMTPGSSTLSFGCVQQLIFIFTDPHTSPLKSLSRTSFSPIYVSSTEDAQTKRALLIHASHTFLLHHAARHAALHSHLSLPHHRHLQFSSLLPPSKAIELCRSADRARYHEVACPQLPLSFSATSNFPQVCVMAPVMYSVI